MFARKGALGMHAESPGRNSHRIIVTDTVSQMKIFDVKLSSQNEYKLLDYQNNK